MLPHPNMVRRRRRQGSLVGCAVLATMTLVTAIIAIMPSTASAKSREYTSQLVRYDDLNLAHSKDVTKLHRRVDRAAKSLCSLPGIAAEILRRDINDCVDQTRAEALQNLELKISMLTADTPPKN
ncbi:MAG: UrcA family protein [Parasphingorhabdus sp.]|uniref:UrcA family protein n=1 Tax=Parasphingorhabdus sp. TaxID=2709688 RepID=UPI0032972F0A